MAFTVFYGAGNGLLTIARGTVRSQCSDLMPTARERACLERRPERRRLSRRYYLACLLDRMGIWVIAVSSALSLAALAALLVFALPNGASRQPRKQNAPVMNRGVSLAMLCRG